jgi:hypothetical protein
VIYHLHPSFGNRAVQSKFDENHTQCCALQHLL